jgi:hypothetical protein
MKLSCALLKSYIYESPSTRLRLDVKEETIGSGRRAAWYWVQIEERNRGRYLDHFLTPDEAIHLACTMIISYRGDLEKLVEVEHLKAYAQALIEKLEGSEEGEEK